MKKQVFLPFAMGLFAGTILVSLLVFSVDTPDPSWGENWKIKPLLVTPLVGGIAGLFYAFMEYLSKTGFNRTLALLLGICGFLVILWMGLILGLDGTLWN